MFLRSSRFAKKNVCQWQKHLNFLTCANLFLKNCEQKKKLLNEALGKDFKRIFNPIYFFSLASQVNPKSNN